MMLTRMPICSACGERHFRTTPCAPRPASPDITTEKVLPGITSEQALPTITLPLLTIIESPYAGAVAANLAYARHCVRHSILLGEIPFASHLLYTQPTILDDRVPAQRELAMSLGYVFYAYASQCVVYDDLGISPGMREGIEMARNYDLPVIFRRILGDPSMFPLAMSDADDEKNTNPAP